MNEKQKKALDFHLKGHNCCQSIVCTYAEDLGMDEETLFKISEGFGSGMGNLQGVCGALSGALIVAGSLNSAGCIVSPPTKTSTYKITGEMSKSFEAKVGSLICQEIKGVKSGKVLRTCDGCIEDAVNIVEKYCFNR